MPTKIWVLLTVLRLRSISNAVRENGLQAVYITPRQVGMHIQRNSRQMLSHGGPHQASLAMLNRKSLFGDNPGNVVSKPVSPTRKLRPARKGKIVGIACVDSLCRLRKPTQSTIKSKRTEIGKRWRGRRTLRKMWSSIENTSALKLRSAQLTIGMPPQASRSRRCTQTAQKVCYRFRVSKRTKERLNARARDRRKEILKIKPQHGFACNVGCSERKNGSSLAEAVHCWMEWNRHQDFAQNLPLNVFQVLHGRFHQANAAMRLRKDATVVVIQQRDAS